MDRIRADLRKDVLTDASTIAPEEVSGLLALYMQATNVSGDPARLAGSLNELRRRFPESTELYAELFAAFTAGVQCDADLALPQRGAVPAPMPAPALPFLAPRATAGVDEPWTIKLRNRVFGGVPAIVVRLGDSLVDALLAPSPAFQGVLVRGHEDDWDADLLAPVLAQEVTLEGRNYFAELFARHSSVSLNFIAGLTGDEPLPPEAKVHLRVGRTSRSSTFARDGRADLGAMPFDLLAQGARVNQVELVFELPHTGAR
ncbi:MAG: hypothetical protein ACRC1H_16650 [Caldilineaceae bacterium]